jgi:hypothetical protein
MSVYTHFPLILFTAFQIEIIGMNTFERDVVEKVALVVLFDGLRFEHSRLDWICLKDF